MPYISPLNNTSGILCILCIQIKLNSIVKKKYLLRYSENKLKDKTISFIFSRSGTAQFDAVNVLFCYKENKKNKLLTAFIITS